MFLLLPPELIKYITDYLSVVYVSRLKLTCTYLNQAVEYRYQRTILKINKEYHIIDRIQGFYRSIIKADDGKFKITNPCIVYRESIDKKLSIKISSYDIKMSVDIFDDNLHGICSITTKEVKIYTIYVSNTSISKHISVDKLPILTEEYNKKGTTITIYNDSWKQYTRTKKFDTIISKTNSVRYEIINGIVVGSFEVITKDFIVVGTMNKGFLQYYSIRGSIIQYETRKYGTVYTTNKDNILIYECYIYNKSIKYITIGVSNKRLNNMREKIYDKDLYRNLCYSVNTRRPFDLPRYNHQQNI